MTITASPPPAPATQPASAEGASPPSRSGARRVAIWLGGAVALIGALLAIAGGGLLAVFGSDGNASTGRDELSTPTAALVSGTASIDTGGFVDDLGSARVTISAHAAGDRPVFVGVGRATDVDRYLAGAARDEVTDFDAGLSQSNFTVKRERHPGSTVPAAPARQSFWVARSTGRASAAVDWKVRDGDYKVVVMNADGSRGVATRTKFGVDVPYLPGVAIGLLAAGLLMTAGGIAAVVAGARRPGA